MKIVSLFNHKGGVSKTTTTFNLGWMLASLGHKTLIVDADPQCNLTTLVLDYNSVEDTERFYAANPGCDIASGLRPAMQGDYSSLSAGAPIETTNPNLFLYCGNLLLSESETQISVALTTSQAIPAIKNIPGSVREILEKTGLAHDFDVILIDMSPSVGALNQCLFMASDYFIVPTSPDFFCAQAVKSLSRVIPRWNQQINIFRGDEVQFKFPQNPPKFLGFISQRYRPRNGSPAMSFQRWIDQINATVMQDLIPAITPLGMTISEEDFASVVEAREPFNLANIADFNSLIAQSQKHNTPVFSLTDSEIEQSGVILDNMKLSRDNFRTVFENLANNVYQLMQRF